MATSAAEIRTRDDFDALVKSIEGRPGYRRPAAFAVGIASFSSADEGTNGAAVRVLDTYYPVVNLHENYGSAAILASMAGYAAGSATFALNPQQVDAALTAFTPFLHDGQEHANIRALQDVREFLRREEQGQLVPRRVVATFIGDLAEKPVDAHDVYLRLHLLSHRKVQPHALSLEGAIGLLTNVAWTSAGPFAADQLDRVRSRLRAKGQVVQVFSVDKFPRMTDYVVPSGVRIADADRVRLGAYVGEGTTVMHEGFINFNAGTLGASMVEGRISAGVVVGNGSDIGGGASIMGTLSGGGKIVVKVGENCLIGANGGIGISLGNGCSVEAGLYVTAGAKVKLPDGRVVKAAELSGQDDLLFIRNSQTGAIEVRAKKNQVVLNPELHSKQ